MKPAITERTARSPKRHLGNTGSDGGGGIGELFVRTKLLRSSDETCAVPQPGALRKSVSPRASLSAVGLLLGGCFFLVIIRPDMRHAVALVEPAA